MPLAYNEETGEIIPYLERKYISKEEAKKMFPTKPKNDEVDDEEDLFKQAVDE